MSNATDTSREAGAPNQTRSLMDAVRLALTSAGHPRVSGRRAGFKLAGLSATVVEVIWVPETLRRTPDRRAEALEAAKGHAVAAQAAGWGAEVHVNGGWPVCRVTRPDSEEG